MNQQAEFNTYYNTLNNEMNLFKENVKTLTAETNKAQDLLLDKYSKRKIDLDLKLLKDFDSFNNDLTNCEGKVLQNKRLFNYFLNKKNNINAFSVIDGSDNTGPSEIINGKVTNKNFFGKNIKPIISNSFIRKESESSKTYSRIKNIKSYNVNNRNESNKSHQNNNIRSFKIINKLKHYHDLRTK